MKNQITLPPIETKQDLVSCIDGFIADFKKGQDDDLLRAQVVALIMKTSTQARIKALRRAQDMMGKEVEAAKVNL